MTSPDVIFADAERGTLLRHAGELSWREFPDLAGRMREHLAAARLVPAVRRRVFSAFVEMTYNVLHYGEPALQRHGDARRVAAEIALGRDGDCVWMSAANLVTSQRAAELEKRLADLRAMGPEGARRRYRDQLARDDDERPRGSKGAGLGLLTIAREGSRPIEYAIVPSSSRESAWFRLKVFV